MLHFTIHGLYCTFCPALLPGGKLQWYNISLKQPADRFNLPPLVSPIISKGPEVVERDVLCRKKGRKKSSFKLMLQYCSTFVISTPT